MASSSSNIPSSKEVFLRVYNPVEENLVWYRTLLNSSGGDNYKKQKMTIELHKFIEPEPGDPIMLYDHCLTCAAVSPYIYLCGSPARGSKLVWRINTRIRDSNWERCPDLTIERCKPFPFVVGNSLIFVGSVSPLYMTSPYSSLPLGDVLEDASVENLQKWECMPCPPGVNLKEFSLCAAHTETNKLIYVPYKSSTFMFAYDFKEKSWSSSIEVKKLICSKPKAFVVDESFVWWDDGCICISDLTLKKISRKSCASMGLIGKEYAPLIESKVQFLHIEGHLFLLIWKKDSKFHFLELGLHPFINHGQIKLHVSICSKYDVEDSESHCFGEFQLIDAIVM